MGKAKDFARDLRAIADWYENQPIEELPGATFMSVGDPFLDNKEQVVRIAKALGEAEKHYNSSIFRLEKQFGDVTLQFVSWRSSVCERKVVGTKDVPEKVIAAHKEEIVEWDCHPLLAPTKEEVA